MILTHRYLIKIISSKSIKLSSCQAQWSSFIVSSQTMIFDILHRVILLRINMENLNIYHVLFKRLAIIDLAFIFLMQFVMSRYLRNFVFHNQGLSLGKRNRWKKSTYWRRWIGWNVSWRIQSSPSSCRIHTLANSCSQIDSYAYTTYWTQLWLLHATRR